MKQVEIDFEYLEILGSLLSKVTFCGGMGTFIPCTIAGGAIRDMLLQKPVSDIDVFYEGDLKESVLNLHFKNVKSTNSTYPDGFNVTHNIEYGSIPVPIQLIQVQNIQKHIDKFPTPLSRVQYSHKNGLEGVNMDFVYFVSNKCFEWDDKVDMYYFDKLKEKYSDWKHTFLKKEYDPYYEEQVEF